MKKNYKRLHGKLTERIIRHYEARGASVYVCRSATGLMLLGKHPSGTPLVGKIKPLMSSVVHTMRWAWKGHRDVGGQVPADGKVLKGASLGWYHWLDGTLGRWVQQHRAVAGELVLDLAPLFESDLFAALDFMKSAGKVQYWRRDYDRNLGFYSIRFANVSRDSQRQQQGVGL